MWTVSKYELEKAKQEARQVQYQDAEFERLGVRMEATNTFIIGR